MSTLPPIFPPPRLVSAPAVAATEPDGLVGERLTLASFFSLAGHLAGSPFVKLVVDKTREEIHFLRESRFKLHSEYLREHFEADGEAAKAAEIVPADPQRRLYLATLCLQPSAERDFFTVEIADSDEMTPEMIAYLYTFVRAHLDPAFPLYFKPVTHAQESRLAELPPATVPRVYLHELFAAAQFIPLSFGMARGRLRFFDSEERFQQVRHTVRWHDIIVMDRVPDSIPRILGIINASQVTPLSHTNILASSWQIPNAVQLGIKEKIRRECLDGEWVEYAVQPGSSAIFLRRIERPPDADKGPAWNMYKVRLEPPETASARIAPLHELRVVEKYRYGTKAANLGELFYVLRYGSERLLGFYRLRRPSGTNLLAELARFLKEPADGDLTQAANRFLGGLIQVPRGIALPFATMRVFLESSAQIQQTIGKLKMALELGAGPAVESLAVSLQQLIRATPIPDSLRAEIDQAIVQHLSGIDTFVVRSSSNAEDLEGFSAAGLYESVNQVTNPEKLFDSIRQVWASLLSPRSIRLSHDVGISLEDSYMGVIIQEEIPSHLGGVLVTTNPMNRADFRDVYFNLSRRSVADVVQGRELPYQCLYNIVEGGGRTLARGTPDEDLPDAQKKRLEQVAFAGKLLQSHFSPDYHFDTPLDIEWLSYQDKIAFLQLRPYGW